MSATIALEPIGVVRSARDDPEPDRWGGPATIELCDRFGEDALLGIEEFSHAEIVYYFHAASPDTITYGARHPRDNRAWPRIGIFAQRGSSRPNLIGCTIVKIAGREGRALHVRDLDAIDGTPVLDIKPVMREFLPHNPVRQPAWSHDVMAHYWDVPETPDKEAS